MQYGIDERSKVCVGGIRTGSRTNADGHVVLTFSPHGHWAKAIGTKASTDDWSGGASLASLGNPSGWTRAFLG